jgi:hypothetical protein
MLQIIERNKEWDQPVILNFDGVPGAEGREQFANEMEALAAEMRPVQPNPPQRQDFQFVTF